MADRLQLRVLTPGRQLYDEAAVEVTAEGTVGQFGVLPDHAAFLTSLEPGPLSFRRPGGGGAETLAVKGGYAEVRDNVMTVLADDAMTTDDIDPAAARRDLERAEQALADLGYGDPERERMERERRWAETRIGLARA